MLFSEARQSASIRICLLLLSTCVAGSAQTADRLDWKGKLQFHAKDTYSPQSIVGFAAYAAALQEIDTPEEWGQGWGPYGKRVASTAGWSAIHGVMAFGLDA